MLDLYLRELERDLARKLSADEIRTVLAETRDHIEQSIQARLELGATAEEAERAALAAFGAHDVLVAPLTDVRRHQYLGLRLGGLALASLGFMLAQGCFIVVGAAWMAVAVLAVIALLAAWSFALGLRARRAAPVPYALGGFVAAISFVAFLGTFVLNLSAFGGAHGIVRWNARQIVRASLVEPSSPGRTWSVRDGQGRTVTYSEARMVPPYDDSGLVAIDRAEADPLGNALSQAGTGFSCGMAFASIAGAADLLGAGLGWLWARRRTRRPTLA